MDVRCAGAGRVQTKSAQETEAIQDLRALSRSDAIRAIDRLKNGKPNGADHGPIEAGVVH